MAGSQPFGARLGLTPALGWTKCGRLTGSRFHPSPPGTDRIRGLGESARAYVLDERVPQVTALPAEVVVSSAGRSSCCPHEMSQRLQASGETIRGAGGHRWAPAVPLVGGKLDQPGCVGGAARPLRGRGSMSARISCRRERRARSTIARFGSLNDSGSGGTSRGGTRRKLASRSLSAMSHASIARTATRKHMRGDGRGSQVRTNGGAQSASRSRSTSTSDGLNRAALL